MSVFSMDCPRCGVKQITFDLHCYHRLEKSRYRQVLYEGFCVCRACSQSVIITFTPTHLADIESAQTDLLHEKLCVTDLVEILGHVGIADLRNAEAPLHVPEAVARAYIEGSKCFAVGCWNAAAAMFRLSIDIATKAKLPAADGPNDWTRSHLSPRLEWLFENEILPSELKDLSSCIKDYGNDGAHDGNLTKEDAEDLKDFVLVLLERIYTEPEKIRIAQQRREERRKQQ